MIVFPKQITQRFDLTRKIVIRYDGLLYNIPPTCFINFERGFKIVLPPGTLPHEACSGGKANPMTFSCSDKDGNVVTMRRLFSEEHDDCGATSNEVITIEKDTNKPSPLSKKKKQPLNTTAKTAKKSLKAGTVNFNNMFTHFDALVHVFQYLRRPHLLQVARVCRVWRRAAVDISLVRTLLFLLPSK